MYNTIETGIEYESDVRDEDAEVYGFADDGEHAVVLAVWTDEPAGSYGVAAYFCEAGLCDRIDERFDEPIDQFDSPEAVARNLVEEDGGPFLDAAREYWMSK